jgi:hypothetical protein
MKKLLGLLCVALALALVYGCSDSPNTSLAPDQQPNVTLVPRPEFIETRPEAEVQAAIIKADPNYQPMLDKKPPKPPPEPPDTTDPNPNPAHKYAYIVGISDYEGTINDLNYCDDDARDMKNMLQGEGFTIQMDLDRNATADAIIDGLQWLVNQAEPGDEIAFCYSGHGYKAPGEGSSIISTDLYYITHGYVMQYLNQVDCSKKLITLDACVIGDFHSDAVNGTMMATASNRKDSYDAPDLNNGAWTYYFLDGANNEGLVFAEDCADWAEDGMKAWASQYHLRVDPKHSDKYDGMFDM